MTVRRLTLCAMLIFCLALAGPAWAGTILFSGISQGEGQLNFDPGSVGNQLTVASDGTNPGAVINTMLDNLGFICGSVCAVNMGYLTLTSGGYLGGGGCDGFGNCSYGFGAGGVVKVFGAIPTQGINSQQLLFSAAFTNGSFNVAGSVGSYNGGLQISSIFLNPLIGTFNYTGASGDAITISLDTACSMGGVCTGLVNQAGVSLQTIPEPATLSVLGSGLFALGTGLKRKLLQA